MAAAPSGAEAKELQDCPSAFSARDATPHHWFWVSSATVFLLPAATEHCFLICYSPHSATATQQSYIQYYLYNLIGLSMLGFQRVL